MTRMLPFIIWILTAVLLYFSRFPSLPAIGWLSAGWIVGLLIIWLERGHVLKHLVASNMLVPKITRSLLFYCVYAPLLLYIASSSQFLFGTGLGLGVASQLLADMIVVLMGREPINEMVFTSKPLKESEGRWLALATLAVWGVAIATIAI